MTKKIVTVVGATGKQGTGIIAALPKDIYHIRGLTRNPGSAAATALSSQGVEVVKTDIGNLDSLEIAFSGSHIIFAVTDFYESFEKYGPEKAMEIETQQGINMAKAAAAVPTLEHYIWSTLPKSSGPFHVPHFEGKHRVDEYIRTDAALLAKTTFIMVCYYAENLALPSYRPYWIETAKKYVQFTTYGPATSVPLIGDVTKNVTPFIKAILDQPGKTKNGAMVIASSESVTAEDWVQAWARAKGVQVQTVRISRDDYDKLWPWPHWAEEFAKMFDFFENVPVQEWLVPGQQVLTRNELGITELESLQEWAKRYELPSI
ncbi:hypothetical protein QBC47DRAFT_420024 [Echria macrotheca]|uniref:NmrA-like domain-containing protein n=1 Tax=Echria macrotheca TaxID=438768 RepID=A0AAJ0BIH9_9PEZI|nr:hypothetical protein QBC47DRAFT_420024 [Echria macrotheca]